MIIPQLKPDITAVINKIVIIPPGKKVIKPIPLSIYKATKLIREIKNIFGSTTFQF